MKVSELGLGKVFFLYSCDPGANQVSYHFASAQEVVKHFHQECGITPLPRRADGLGANQWRVFVQEKQGSLVSTEISVTAENAQAALEAYYDAVLLQVINERTSSPTGKSLFLCEGERGLPWLLDPVRLEALFKSYCPEFAESSDSQTVLFEWLCYGVLSASDYMAILTDVADRYPLLINSAQRVQLAMQIVEHNRIFR